LQSGRIGQLDPEVRLLPIGTFRIHARLPLAARRVSGCPRGAEAPVLAMLRHGGVMRKRADRNGGRGFR